MKIDRHNPRSSEATVKHRAAADGNRLARVSKRLLRPLLLVACCALTGAIVFPRIHPNRTSSKGSTDASVATAVSRSNSQDSNSVHSRQSDTRAVGLLGQVITMVVHGPAFHAKVRETVWTNGREVVGVGTYQQAGGGSGRFNLQVTMHDGDGKHRLQQISDGRLAWTRTEVAGAVSLRRVDVGRLDEWVGKNADTTEIAPSLMVGAWAELLSSIERDYVLDVVGAHLQEEPVWVLTGKLRLDKRNEILNQRGSEGWPMLFPTRIRIAIRAKSDPKSGIGEFLPIRYEFWSDPVTADADAELTASGGRLINLIELYSIQPIAPPTAEDFRFENQEAEVNFVNETDRYIELYGIQLTERELRQLRR